MKNKLMTIMLIATTLFTQFSFAQNLVPNPSFEDTVHCVLGTNDLEAAAEWMNFGNSPDYFNTCSPTNGMRPPNMVFGYQYPHTGNALAGIATYLLPSLPSGPNYREFLGTKLNIPMQVGSKYFYSFFANYSFYHPIEALASDKIGLRFSTVAFDSCCPPPINNFATCYTDLILSDTVAWVRISGSFFADSLYEYITIGNFFDDGNTDTLHLSQYNHASYYYIDDICVTTDSIFNENWTEIIDITDNLPKFIFYPNPYSGILSIKSTEKINEFQLIDILGRVVFECRVNALEWSQELPSNIQDGMYFLAVRIKDKTISQHISIIQKP